MEKDKRKKLREALKSDEDFIKLLKQGSQSDDYQKIKMRLAKGPHPSNEMLYNYVLNWTDDADDEKIMDHMVYCPQCSQEVLRIMKIEDELEKDMQDWIEKIPLLNKLKMLVSNLSLPVYSFPATRVVTRGEGEPELKTQYRLNESIVFCVPVKLDGYLVILHYDESENVTMVLPSSPQDDTFVSAGSEKKISGIITEPVGMQNFKAIWTSKQLMDPGKIDFNDEEDIERAIDEFIDDLTDLDDGEWIETDYMFEVVED